MLVVLRATIICRMGRKSWTIEEINILQIMDAQCQYTAVQIPTSSTDSCCHNLFAAEINTQLRQLFEHNICMRLDHFGSKSFQCSKSVCPTAESFPTFIVAYGSP